MAEQTELEHPLSIEALGVLAHLPKEPSAVAIPDLAVDLLGANNIVNRNAIRDALTEVSQRLCTHAWGTTGHGLFVRHDVGAKEGSCRGLTYGIREEHWEASREYVGQIEHHFWRDGRWLSLQEAKQ